MGVANRFAGDCAQAKTLVSVETSALEPAIVEGQRFGFAVFDIKLAVIGIPQRLADERLQLGFGEVEIGKEIGFHGPTL
jgi:hypothetical protein